MTRILRITELAEGDVENAAGWYEQRQLGLGQAFTEKVDAILEKVLNQPEMFPCVGRRANVRRALTQRFPYRIYFLVRPSEVLVFRVLHAAQHDREWKRAIPDQ